ncbi:hypothetical protein MASR2M78_06160 [Treponema sp.]
MKVSRIVVTGIALFAIAAFATAEGQKETVAKKVPLAGPAGVASPEDEGVVKPIAKKSERPLKIAVIGLENNPFWIPVKEGAYKAAAEYQRPQPQG